MISRALEFVKQPDCANAMSAKETSMSATHRDTIIVMLSSITQKVVMSMMWAASALHCTAASSCTAAATAAAPFPGCMSAKLFRLNEENSVDCH